MKRNDSIWRGWRQAVLPAQIGHSTDVSKIGTFARYLREMFRADNDAATLRLAAETLGRLVAAGGALTADVVEQEVHAR